MYKNFIKRIFDIIASLIGLIILSPLIILLIIVLTISFNGTPFFLHPRPGKHGVIFKVIKFKSMNDKKDEHGVLLPHNMRVTKTGDFIRKFSLDELPQLINVLKGDMSLIGPRPLEVRYLPLYNEFQKQRHNVKPGISGWAQVNGRNTVSWDEKFEMDVWYVNNISFITDLRIILLTIKKVLLRKDINASETLNMAPFLGNN
ncbi:sugar transferase [Algibacter luteus]|jgi:lipopolysaccharide/colanic/teichoic acid biosynthesis glycosyltransferase|uniref:Sugar transferase involved in LPS biosynthesis (Colanic, teichoic acid) n=1 Tax=Algibacter luteus TaxID=1178825 RepID=A0A1M6BJH2_9FLAO|nr:sugar transferase [Algibacter luteus]SHI48633.1 Sugar transferase involved in LPS biosynthesis (colanic, teichoic acid) [Algibacter luteus]